MDFDRMLYLRRCAETKRFHAQRTIRQQTVAEHSAQAQQIALMLLSLNNLLSPEAIARVLVRVLTHDLAEGYTGDVPSPAKVQNAELKQALDNAEMAWGARNLPAYALPYLENLTREEERVCKAADWLELLLWSADEYEMGNRAILEVYHNIKSYLMKAPHLMSLVGVPETITETDERVLR